MQTFLPYPSFEESARVLDRARLDRQRVETLQILEMLTCNRLVSSAPLNGRASRLPAERWHLEARLGTGRSPHPAVLMWSGCIPGLLAYQRAVCDEWTRRGHRDTCREKAAFLVEASGFSPDPVSMPVWWGSERFHAAHRAALMAEDPAWYGQFGWVDASDPDGLWPVSALDVSGITRVPRHTDGMSSVP
jgi:hypothetical protein